MFASKQRIDGSIRHIRNSGLLRGCDDAELRRVTELSVERVYPAGAMIVKAGTHGSEFFLIVEGLAVVSIGARRIATLGPGEFFGDVALLIGAPRAADVVAKSGMRVRVFTRSQFSTLLEVGSVRTEMLRAKERQAIRINGPDSPL